MFKAVPMKKVSAVVLEEKKDQVLRELKEKGLIQFIDTSDSDDFKNLQLESANLSWIKVAASELISRVNNVLDSFKLIKKDKSIFKELLSDEPAKIQINAMWKEGRLR